MIYSLCMHNTGPGDILSITGHGHTIRIAALGQWNLNKQGQMWHAEWSTIFAKDTKMMCAWIGHCTLLVRQSYLVALNGQSRFGVVSSTAPRGSVQLPPGCQTEWSKGAYPLQPWQQCL